MTPKQVVRAWIKAFNRADAAAIAALYAEDAINHQVRGCGFFQVANDQIRFQRGYWDQLSFRNTHR